MSDFIVKFQTDIPVNSVYETRLSIVRGEPAPKGTAAIVDAEGEVVAFVPDKVALVNPDRRLPEIICTLLGLAADYCKMDVDHD